jgi:hypothetical protein
MNRLSFLLHFPAGRRLAGRRLAGDSLRPL